MGKVDGSPPVLSVWEATRATDHLVRRIRSAYDLIKGDTLCGQTLTAGKPRALHCFEARSSCRGPLQTSQSLTDPEDAVLC